MDGAITNFTLPSVSIWPLSSCSYNREGGFLFSQLSQTAEMGGEIRQCLWMVTNTTPNNLLQDEFISIYHPAHS
jgi:hypothetical protein